MKRCLASLLAVVLLVSMAGCVAAKPESTSPAPIHVGLLTNGGPVDDRGMNQEAWEGLLQLQQEIPGLQADYRIPGADGDEASCVEQLAALGCSLIVWLDCIDEVAVSEAALRFPHLQFAAVGCENLEFPNLACVQFSMEEAAYLAGISAVVMSESRRVGCVHGRLIPETERLVAAFMAGAKAGDSEGVVLRGNALRDNDGGTRAAEDMVANGVDVIFHADGGEHSAVIAACRENGIWAVGAQQDRSSQAPGHVLVSAVQKMGSVVADLVRKTAAGQFESGVHIYGVENDGVGLSSDLSLLSEAAVNSVNRAKVKIADGTINIPVTLEELEKTDSETTESEE